MRWVFSLQGDEYIFTPCTGASPVVISNDSRAYAIIQAVYTERTLGVDENTAFYAVIVGKGSVSSENDMDIMEVALVVRAPEQGKCSSETPSTHSETE